MLRILLMMNHADQLALVIKCLRIASHTQGDFEAITQDAVDLHEFCVPVCFC